MSWLLGQDLPRALGVRPGSSGPWRWVVALLSLAACGSPNAKILPADHIEADAAPPSSETFSEAAKIRKLIDEVRHSDAHFITGGQERTGSEAAADLEQRVPRMSISTSRQFVEHLGSPRDSSQPEPQVRLADGTLVPAKGWFLARLQEIEGGPRLTQRELRAEANGSPAGPQPLGILDALTLVERSQLRFVAPARHLPNGTVRGKPKEYDAQEFAEMLRKKWDFLGADVRDLDTFIAEIATDSFSSMEPYRVVLADGEEQEFRTWLQAQLDERRKALARAQAHRP